MLAALALEWMRTRWLSRTRQQAIVIAGCLILATGLELTQFLVTSRSPSLQDLLAAFVGTLGGVTVVPALVTSTTAPAAMTAATALAAIPFYLQPFTLAPAYGSIALMPFLAYYEYTSMQTISHVLDLMLIYAPIGFAIVWTRGRLGLTSAAIVIGIVAAVLEYSQGWIAGRYPDVTDFGVAMLGGVCGAALALNGWSGRPEGRSEGRPDGRPLPVRSR